MSEGFPTIPEFYRGRKVLVTGGTGFMGKVLIEKLLRSCPDIDTVYLLLRAKKGRDVQARIKDITDLALFNRLREENPAALSKLVAVGGDVKELGLGLSEEDRRLLQDSVSVVFHSAASVRFDDPIRDAVLVNVRGTRELVELALGMRNLKVMLHLSTTYCNFDQPEVFEKLYDPPADWRRVIALVERTEDDHVIRSLTHKVLGVSPNTYIFAKALSEQIINDYSDRLPLVIVRPSIVVSSLSEPFPGWVDNFNGPIGLMVAGGKGLLRSVYADPNNIGDYVPVDVAIKSMIFIAWHRAMYCDVTELPVYNCSSMTIPTTLYDVIDMGKIMGDTYPLDNIMWYRNPTITHSRFRHYLKVIFYHMLPALIIDGILKLLGKKPMLIKLHRKIFIANETLAVFTTNPNEFNNDKFKALQEEAMRKEDVKDFGYNEVLTDRFTYMKSSILGARIHLLKEPLSTLPAATVHQNRMIWLDKIAKTCLLLFFIWIINVPALVKTFTAFMGSVFEFIFVA